MGGRSTNDRISLPWLEIIFPLVQQILQFLAISIYIPIATLTPWKGEILDVESLSPEAR